MAASQRASRSTTQRNEIAAVSEFLNAADSSLAVFRNVGDKFAGIVQGARMVDTEIQGKIKRDAKGNPKRHLQVLLLDEEGQEWVVNVMSQNQKAGLRKALADVGLTSLARGDYYSMEFEYEDTPIREDLSPTRVFKQEVTPAK
jgi:hypothetical protein